jgi:hypothetical protein
MDENGLAGIGLENGADLRKYRPRKAVYGGMELERRQVSKKQRVFRQFASGI